MAAGQVIIPMSIKTDPIEYVHVDGTENNSSWKPLVETFEV